MLIRKHRSNAPERGLSAIRQRIATVRIKEKKTRKKETTQCEKEKSGKKHE